MLRTMLLRCLLVGAALGPAALHADEAVWSLLRSGGQVVLLRHDATDPGVGDPPGMKLDDCSTQRNLSEAGRAHARRLGEALRSRAVPVAAVQASPWCRCLETARLVFGRAGDVQPALGNLFMVTHGSTIHALTGVSPGMGELVVLAPQAGGFRVAGRLSVP